VALIANTPLIGTPPVQASVGRAHFQFPGGQTTASYAKLAVEQAVEVDRKLVSGFSLNSNQVHQENRKFAFSAFPSRISGKSGEITRSSSKIHRDQARKA